MSSFERWLRIVHRASVIARAVTEQSSEQIQADHDHELVRVGHLLTLVGRVATTMGEPPSVERKSEPRRDPPRRATH